MFITVTCCEETAKKLFESFLYLHMMFHIYKLLQDILTSAPTTLCRPSESWPSKFQDFPVPCNKISRTKLIFQEFPDPRNFINTIPGLSQRCGKPAKRYLSLFSHFCRAKHTHTHPFNGPFSGTTHVGRYQKGKTNLDFTEARDSEWHQLGHMQVCTSLQTDNHTSTPQLSFSAELNSLLK